MVPPYEIIEPRKTESLTKPSDLKVFIARTTLTAFAFLEFLATFLLELFAFYYDNRARKANRVGIFRIKAFALHGGLVEIRS